MIDRAPKFTPFDIPVVLILYKRADKVRQALNAIRLVEPRDLFVVADGPKRPEEDGLCERARAVINEIDWECRVTTEYAERNLGIRKRFVSGMDRVFSRYESAIFIEEDMVPDPSFFHYCDELLKRYAADKRIFSIGGLRYVPTLSRSPADYIFSRYCLIGAWAMWRRSWEQCDFDLKQWPELRDSGVLNRLLGDQYAVKYWQLQFQRYYDGLDTYDYAMMLSCFANAFLNIAPSRNLVTDNGYGEGATFTKDARSPFSNMPAESLTFPLQHPGAVVRDPHYDELLEKRLFGGNLERVMGVIRGRG